MGNAPHDRPMTGTPLPAAPEEPTEPLSPTVQSANEVRLVGRLGANVSTRILPSGDELIGFSVVVDRERPGSNRQVDTVPCQCLSPELRAVVASLPNGAWIEVRGRLRRRFWRGSQGLGSALEVDARVVRHIACE